MSLGAPIVCVGEGQMPGLVSALTAGIRYPVLAAGAAEAPARIAGAAPAAVVVAAEQVAADLLAAMVRAVERLDGPYVPLLARIPETARGLSLLPIAADATPARVVARLTAALRIRALHGTITRRAAAQQRGDAVAAYATYDGLDEATVLVAGRGGGYPGLTMAVGERVGLIGALSFETAGRYLEGRDIDGVVVGDGFSGRAVENFIDTMRADVRFRDLPLVVADSRIGPLDLDGLPNADQLRAAPDGVVAHLLPLVRLHAFGLRLKRWAASLDSKGFIDADTGLLTCDAFVGDLARAIAECEKAKGSLSLARFSFGRITRPAYLDAARIVGRLVRATDFACQDDDGAIHIAFGDTDLKAAHVVARRIASVLKHTMLLPDPDAPRLDPEVSLVTRKPSDTAETLLARVNPATVAAE
jgi:hypothetical protein